MMPPLVQSDSTIDLKGSWNTFWGQVSDSISGITSLMAILGVVLIAFAIIKFFWDKRRGGGGGMGSLVWPIVLGCALAAPGLIIPLLLGIFDTIANSLANLLSSQTA